MPAQVFAGQQHHLGVTIDGIAYEIALGGEKDFAAAAGRQALPPGTVSAGCWQLGSCNLGRPKDESRTQAVVWEQQLVQ